MKALPPAAPLLWVKPEQEAEVTHGEGQLNAALPLSLLKIVADLKARTGICSVPLGKPTANPPFHWDSLGLVEAVFVTGIKGSLLHCGIS